MRVRAHAHTYACTHTHHQTTHTRAHVHTHILFKKFNKNNNTPRKRLRTTACLYFYFYTAQVQPTCSRLLDWCLSSKEYLCCANKPKSSFRWSFGPRSAFLMMCRGTITRGLGEGGSLSLSPTQWFLHLLMPSSPTPTPPPPTFVCLCVCFFFCFINWGGRLSH